MIFGFSQYFAEHFDDVQPYSGQTKQYILDVEDINGGKVCILDCSEISA